MIGVIYKITNNINEKVYIGQTVQKIETRWKRHIRESKTNCRHLYCAMRKYGIENFSIEVIEECDTEDELDEREQYWINQYDSCNRGYNISKGGGGYRKYDVEEILNMWDKGFSVSDISLLLDIPYSTVEPYIRNYKADFREKSKSFKSATMMKEVSKYSLDGDYIETFIGLSIAAKSINRTVSAIGLCCSGINDSCGGYQWRYGDSKENIGAVKNTLYGNYIIKQYSKDMELINTFHTIAEASRETKICNISISKCCHNKIHTAGGFIWTKEVKNV